MPLRVNKGSLTGAEETRRDLIEMQCSPCVVSPPKVKPLAFDSLLKHLLDGQGELTGLTEPRDLHTLPLWTDVFWGNFRTNPVGSSVCDRPTARTCWLMIKIIFHHLSAFTMHISRASCKPMSPASKNPASGLAQMSSSGRWVSGAQASWTSKLTQHF